MLHIKGPTVALWLYDLDERPWGDVDILVAPDRLNDAVSALMDAGYRPRFAGVGPGTTEDHAVTLVRSDDGAGETEIDVHWRFEGVGVAADQAFRELWRRREPDTMAHVAVWFPDLPSRALLILLNCARSPTSRSRRDLERLIESADDNDWQNVISLGRKLHALPAMRVGFERSPNGGRLVASTGLETVELSPEWALRAAGAPRTALRLARLRQMSWRRRVRAVVRWLVPPAAVIRMRDPSARGGALNLVLGYLRRLVDGVRALGPSWRALRRARPSEGASPGKRSVGRSGL